MKKMYILMALCLLGAAGLRAEIKSGQFEEYNSQWEFDDATGVLTISVIDDDPENEDFGGFGMIPDFEGDFEDENNPTIPTPWWSFKDDIESIVIEEGIQRVGMCAFAMCFYTEHLTLPVNMVQIGRSAFISCSDLKELTFPMITAQRGNGEYYAMEIEKYAFAGCKGIESITSYQMVPPEVEGYEVFADMDVANIPLYVRAECLEDYMDDPDWSEFDIHVFGDNIPELCEVSSTGQWNFTYCQTEYADNGEVSLIFFTNDYWYYDVENDNFVTPREGMALMLTILPKSETWLAGTYNDTNDKLVISKSKLYTYNDGEKDDSPVQSGTVTITVNDAQDAYNLEYDMKFLMWGTDEKDFAGTISDICAEEIQDDTEGIKNVQPAVRKSQKLLRNGQLFIEYNGKTFNAQGTEVQ